MPDPDNTPLGDLRFGFCKSLAQALFAGLLPLEDTRHRKWLADLDLECTLPGDPRVPAWNDLLRALPRETNPTSALRHHAALGYGWVADYPTALVDLIDEVRQTWATRSAGAKGPGGFAVAALELVGGNPMGLATAWETIEGMRDEARFAKVAGLSLASLDFPDETVIRLEKGAQVAFACGCGAFLSRALSFVGTPAACECGRRLIVPTPSLQRVHAMLRAEHEQAQGLRRCRTCGAIVQTAKGPLQSAGFCTKTCAIAGGEPLPVEASVEQDVIVVGCNCGSRVKATHAQVGKLVFCPKCGAQVTVHAPKGMAKRVPVQCPKCNRRSRAGATTCQYCGETIA